MVPVGPSQKRQPVDADPARLHFDRLAGPREVVGPLAVDFQRRKGGRRLLDVAQESLKGAADRVIRRPRIAGGRYVAFRILGRATGRTGG